MRFSCALIIIIDIDLFTWGLAKDGLEVEAFVFASLGLS